MNGGLSQSARVLIAADADMAKVCWNCRHCERWIGSAWCNRYPSHSPQIDAVTGRVVTKRYRPRCEMERAKPSLKERLFGYTRCGADGRFFEAAPEGETPEKRRTMPARPKR